jgi:hypothetical protein
MDAKQFDEWLDRNEEFQRQQGIFERRREYMDRILAASPNARRSRSQVVDFILGRIEKNQKKGISPDESLAQMAQDAEDFSDL